MPTYTYRDCYGEKREMHPVLAEGIIRLAKERGLIVSPAEKAAAVIERCRRRRATAIHEAGHCVVAIALRRRFHSIHIHKGGGGHFQPTERVPPPVSRPLGELFEPHETVVRDELAITLAGMV